MRERKGRRTFDREFKESEVRLIVDGGRSVAEISRSLTTSSRATASPLQRYKLLNNSGIPLGVKRDLGYVEGQR